MWLRRCDGQGSEQGAEEAPPKGPGRGTPSSDGGLDTGTRDKWVLSGQHGGLLNRTGVIAPEGA
jgi:hypothetical protein